MLHGEAYTVRRSGFGRSDAADVRLVDENGVIFYKHVGPISPAQLEKQILPLLEQKLSGTN